MATPVSAVRSNGRPGPSFPKITLSEEFLAPYKTKTPDFGPLGYITYKRTYSRKVKGADGTERTEFWWETVRRVVEGNINLDPRLATYEGEQLEALVEELTKEAELLYDYIFWLAVLPPGRGLWMSGTDFFYEVGDAAINCWAVACRPQPYRQGEDPKVSYPFVFLFDQSMKGGGVGFSVERRNLRQIPPVMARINLLIACRDDHPDFHELESLTPYHKAEYELIQPFSVDADAYVRIEDSREGWGDALRHVIDAHWEMKDGATLVIDVSNIRPRGSEIKRFGGEASGPAPLVELLVNTNYILNEYHKKRLTSVVATDIFNMIGRAVVAGNVRRTAEIAISDATDLAFARMKNWDLAESDWDKWAISNHRWASNNSLVVDDPGYYDSPEFEEVLASVRLNGEPGFFNRYLARNYARIIDGVQPGIDAEVEIPNPCSEIGLASGENCNLFEIFPFNILRLGYSLKTAARLGLRYCKRVTFAHFTWERSQEVVSRNRRVGVSISGFQDWVMHEYGSVVKDWIQGEDGTLEPIYTPELVDAVNELYEAVREADREYSAELGCNESIKVTCVKPSGTVAIVAGGASPGGHFHYFDYGIRRVRIAKSSPLVSILETAGLPMEDALDSPDTVVVEFPFRAPVADNPNFRSAKDATIEEQLAVQAFLQAYWADNMVSTTISFHPHEAEKIGPLMRQYRDHIKSTSFLPYSGHGFAQAPYEPTSKEEYERRMANLLIRPEQLAEIVDFGDLDDSLECADGYCPIR